MEDDYNEGEGAQVNSWEAKEKANDLNSLLKKVADTVNAKNLSEFSKNVNSEQMNDYNFATELSWDSLVDEDNYPVDQKSRDIDLWKKGQKTLYAARYHILISRVGESPVPANEFIKYGIEID